MSFGPKGGGTDVMVLGPIVNWDTLVEYPYSNNYFKFWN